jgi:hypothetical protein
MAVQAAQQIGTEGARQRLRHHQLAQPYLDQRRLIVPCVAQPAVEHAIRVQRFHRAFDHGAFTVRSTCYSGNRRRVLLEK